MKGLILIVILTYFVLIVSFLKWFYRRVIFAPRKKHVKKPTIPYINTTIDGVHLWHFNNHTDRPVFFYCHGSFGNMSYEDHIIKLTDRLGVNLITFDYYGYGLSDGVATPNSLLLSAEKIYNYALKFYPPEKIIVIGHSLGGAPAIYITKQFNIKKMILISTFASLDQIPQEMGWLPRIISMPMKYLYSILPNSESIKEVKADILILHSPDDDLISYDHAIQLFTNVSHERRKLVKIGGKHATPVLEGCIVEEIVNHCELGVNPDCRDILKELAERDPYEWE